MKSTWTAGLDEEQEKEIREEFVHSSFLRSRLTQLLNDKIMSGAEFRNSKKQYEYAAWPYLQADSVGYERALREIISLLEK
jgi:hypothetical protein